jgi:hypothetical protein
MLVPTLSESEITWLIRQVAEYIESFEFRDFLAVAYSRQSTRNTVSY